jgi:hypothetical protein
MVNDEINEEGSDDVAIYECRSDGDFIDVFGIE